MDDNTRGPPFNRGGGGGGGGGGANNPDGRKGNTAPCPGANGTTIGTSQSFSLQCGLNIGGNVLSEIPMSSFLGCVDNCASTHPRCDGVSFNGRVCRLRGGPNIAQSSRPSEGFDSALAIFPTGLNSRCNTLGPSIQTTASSGAKRYDLSCGKVIDGGDFLQQHTATYFDCMELCARSSMCVAVSFDWDMSNGYNNCYLKNAVTDILSVRNIDTAILDRGGGAPAGQPANPADPASSSPAAGGGNRQGAVPVPVPGGFRPPIASAPGRSGAPPISQGPQGGLTGPDAPLATFATTTRGALLQPPVGAGSSGPAEQPPAEAAASQGTSQAWIAAPVVGGVAAVMLIAVVFALWGRRRGKGCFGGRGSRDGSADNEKGGGGPGQATSDDEWPLGSGRGPADIGYSARNSMASSASRSIRSTRSSRSNRSSISGDGFTGGSGPGRIPPVPLPPIETPKYALRLGKLTPRDSVGDIGSGTDAVPDFLRNSRVIRPSQMNA